MHCKNACQLTCAPSSVAKNFKVFLLSLVIGGVWCYGKWYCFVGFSGESKL